MVWRGEAEGGRVDRPLSELAGGGGVWVAGWLDGWLAGGGGEGEGRGVLQQEYAGKVCRLPATGVNHMTRPRAVWGNKTREQRGGGTTFSLGALN